MDKNHISNIKIRKSNRNTLQFLQETQQYINKICKPIKLDDIEIVPRKINHFNSNKNTVQSSKAGSPDLRKNYHQGDFFVKKRRFLKREHERKTIQNRILSHVLDPLTKHSKKLCSSISVKGL